MVLCQTPEAPFQRRSVAQTVLLGHAPFILIAKLLIRIGMASPLLQTAALELLGGCAASWLCLRHPQPEKLMSCQRGIVNVREGGRAGGEG